MDAVRRRLQSIHEMITTARESVADDSKSSAGDKHETSRAMAQLEQEKLEAQLQEALQMQDDLQRIANAALTDKVHSGSAVVTSQGNFFLAVAIGRLQVGDETWFAISTTSPLGTVLVNRQSGETVSVNGRSFTILSIF
jgi:transcription elongation GreA/GreB family factor